MSFRLLGLERYLQKQVHWVLNFVVVLDDVKDYGNIGTIIRTCHAFGIREVVSTSREFDLYQRKTIEASRGSIFSTSIIEIQSSAKPSNNCTKEGIKS